MNSRSFRRILITVLSSLVLMASGSAHAVFRAYLSVSGSDANPCTVGAPCRLLPAAIAAVDPGGEVWMLDSANFNTGPVDVNKSVTILAIPGALGSVVALGGDAIIVNTPGVSVTLRNLVVLNFSSGAHGINFSQGTRVIVEGCEIYGLPLDGIHATSPSAHVTVKETTIRMNGGAGVYLSGAVTGNLSDTKILHHAIGVNVLDGAKAVILDSEISNSSNIGVSASASGSTTSRVLINNSVIKNVNGNAIDVLANAGGNAQVTVARSTITNAGGAGINVQNGAGTETVILDNNVIIHTNGGVNLNSSGTAVVHTRNNNTIGHSGGPNVIGGALTSMTAY